MMLFLSFFHYAIHQQHNKDKRRRKNRFRSTSFALDVVRTLAGPLLLNEIKMGFSCLHSRILLHIDVFLMRLYNLPPSFCSTIYTAEFSFMFLHSAKFYCLLHVWISTLYLCYNNIYLSKNTSLEQFLELQTTNLKNKFYSLDFYIFLLRKCGGIMWRLLCALKYKQLRAKAFFK
jgi:hypothetical protein